MKQFGLASAIHGTGQLKLTTSIVSGEKKDDIRLIEKRDRILDPNSGKSVREVFNWYLGQILEVVEAQRREIVSTVPIVFGWPIDTDLPQLIRNIRAVFAQYMVKRKKAGVYTAAETNLDKKINHSEDQIRTIRELVQGYVKTGRVVSATDIDFTTRGYINMKFESPPEEIRAEIEEIDPEWERKFLHLKRRAATRPGPRKLLEKEVRNLGFELGLAYILKMRPGLETRFIMPGNPGIPEIAQSVQHNCFHDDERLRQIYAEEFIRVLGITHHISLKCPKDQPSPPFSDVIATHIADKLDIFHHGRIKPAAVRVKMSSAEA